MQKQRRVCAAINLRFVELPVVYPCAVDGAKASGSMHQAGFSCDQETARFFDDRKIGLISKPSTASLSGVAESNRRRAMKCRTESVVLSKSKVWTV
jgi:hypothetical protein